MENLKKKQSLRKSKDLLRLINEAINLDETLIKINGNQKDIFFSYIQTSIQKSFALESKIPLWLKNLDGLSGKKFRYFINNLIDIMPDPKYLEIGSWLGSTACSASYGNTLSITCIDNWSEFFNQDKKPSTAFKKNIKKCISKKSNFSIIEKNFRDVDYSKINKFNLFFFDGPHHMKDHYDAIKLVQPCLEDKFILIIDDWNWKQVRKGTLNAIIDLKLHIEAQIVIRTSQDDLRPIVDSKYSEWHNGYSFFVIKKKKYLPTYSSKF